MHRDPSTFCRRFRCCTCITARWCRIINQDHRLFRFHHLSFLLSPLTRLLFARCSSADRPRPSDQDTNNKLPATRAVIASITSALYSVLDGRLIYSIVNFLFLISINAGYPALVKYLVTQFSLTRVLTIRTTPLRCGLIDLIRFELGSISLGSFNSCLGAWNLVLC